MVVGKGEGMAVDSQELWEVALEVVEPGIYSRPLPGCRLEPIRACHFAI